jgi:hypothetical protein
MTSKLLAATAFSIGLLGASLALAQTGGTGQGGGTSSPDVMSPDSTNPDGTDLGTTRSTSPDIGDLSSYLNGDHVRAFYRDDSLNTLRPEGEVRETFNALSLDDRVQLRAACAVNQDAKYNGLCRSVNSFQ